MAPSSPSTTRRSPPSKNYRRSVNTQIIVCAHARRVVAVDGCRPGNRNDLVIARHTLAHLLAGDPTVLGDGGYRGIDTITTPRRDHSGRIIRDQHWRQHSRIIARIQHVIVRPKDRQTHCVNADAAATPSTTTSKSSLNSGTSRPTPITGHLLVE
jgi:hypothetical protein